MCRFGGGGFDGDQEGWAAVEKRIWRRNNVGNVENAPKGRPVASVEPSSSNAVGGNLAWGRAAFERPLAHVQLTEPDARTVATAVQHRLHQFRWSPLERRWCASFQANVFLVDQIVVKITDDGEVPRLVADAMAAVLNMVNVQLRTGTTPWIGTFP